MYITEANFRRVIRQIDKSEDVTFEDNVLWQSLNGTDFFQDDESCLFVKMFSEYEKRYLLVFKDCCKKPEKLFLFYEKIEEPKDSQNYIEIEKSPSYHSTPHCTALKSNFKGFPIPNEIKEQNKVKEFREYWHENEELRENKPEIFIKRINEKFKLKVGIKMDDVVAHKNSGVHEVVDNRSVAEINYNISKNFKELVEYIEKDKEKRLPICMKLGYLSYFVNNGEDIKNLPDDFEKEDVIEVLKKLHIYKKVIQRDLEKLYMRIYINDLDFNESLLRSLGFKPCYSCLYHEQP